MRGFWFMVEAALAGLILTAFVAFLVSTNLSAAETDYTAIAYTILADLNEQDLLKPLAQSGNFSGINSLLTIASVNHTVQICTPQACTGPAPTGTNVWVGSYLVPGVGIYNPKEVRLYLSS
ncbi:MAG: hypothetical protein HY369_01190 [Candidatus Aenigmarchaeota archaeon]|nr:hypothetical protein [Candidatus Aenigmarchaeota archaeon]